ncbi:LysE family translocator [Nocardioides sp.]|uniref:LysE family translocator n=1 Tax=Nocardioides sp. TaxID=35761 RepID=UPI0035188EAC
MISLGQLLPFALAAGILILIPGPSVVFTVGRALAYGRGVALATVAGNTAGLATIVVLVAAGLGVVVQESIVVFTALKLLGAAYLLYLGVQAIRHRSGFTEADDAGAGLLPLRTAMRQGYVVGVSNPKGFMIMGALLPQFVDRGEGQVAAQMLLLGAVAVALAIVSDSAWAVLAARVRGWFLGSPRRGEALGVVGGASMIGLGVTLALAGRE